MSLWIFCLLFPNVLVLQFSIVSITLFSLKSLMYSIFLVFGNSPSKDWPPIQGLGFNTLYKDSLPRKYCVSASHVQLFKMWSVPDVCSWAKLMCLSSAVTQVGIGIRGNFFVCVKTMLWRHSLFHAQWTQYCWGPILYQCISILWCLRWFLAVWEHCLVELVFLDQNFDPIKQINADWAAQCHKPGDLFRQINTDTSEPSQMHTTQTVTHAHTYTTWVRHFLQIIGRLIDNENICCTSS